MLLARTAELETTLMCLPISLSQKAKNHVRKLTFAVPGEFCCSASTCKKYRLLCCKRCWPLSWCTEFPHPPISNEDCGPGSVSCHMKGCAMDRAELGQSKAYIDRSPIYGLAQQQQHGLQGVLPHNRAGVSNAPWQGMTGQGLEDLPAPTFGLQHIASSWKGA